MQSTMDIVRKTDDEDKRPESKVECRVEEYVKKGKVRERERVCV